MPKKFAIGRRVFLAFVLFAALLGATAGHADTRDADLVRQGTDALKHHDYDTAIARFSDALRLNPEDADAWGGRGEAYASKGDQDRALADCNQGIKLAPASGDAYRECGNVYFSAQDFDRAIANYDKAIMLDPRNAYAYANRGGAFYRLNQIDRAISDYDRALSLDPTLSNTYTELGNAWLVKGDFDRAWDDYNRALQTDPRNAYAYVARGYAATRRYAFDDAIADYDQAIRIDPTYKDAYRYRDEALALKRDASWGYLYLVLIGIGMLAMVFAAFRTFFSPTAFGHGVDRHFKRMPDGRLVFYPKMKGVGYVVPDTEKEQALRVFVRRTRAVSLVFGIVTIGVGFVLLPIVSLLDSWLSAASGISMPTIVTLMSLAEVAIIMAAFFRGLALWRRAATRGLVEASERAEPPRFDQWANDFVQDMPVAVRWIAFAVILFLIYQSLKGLWRERYALSPAGIQNMSLFGWSEIVGQLLALWYFGRLLFFAARQRIRQASQPQRST